MYLQELVGLVPDLGGRLRCLRVEVLQGIWRDEAIPVKLVELKLQFVDADVSRLVARRCGLRCCLVFSYKFQAGCCFAFASANQRVALQAQHFDQQEF